MFFLLLFCFVFVLFCSVLFFFFLHTKDIVKVITDRKTGKLRKLLLADKTWPANQEESHRAPPPPGGSS